MIIRSVRCLLCAVVLAGSAPAATWLLAVGVDSYDDSAVAPLHFASSDARAVVDVFRQAGLPEDRAILLTSDSPERLSLPTKRNLLAALGKVRDGAQPTDSFVFLFSGHGTTAEGQSYLWPMDVDHEAIAETALSVALVNDKLRGLKAAEVLYLIDACRNDPQAGRGEVDAKLDESFAKGMRPAIRRDGAPPKAASLLACQVGQRAWEMPNEGHGLFSYYLLRGLRGEARADDGAVRLASLAGYLQRSVPAWAREHGRVQEPLVDNPDSLDFVLLRPPVVRELPRSATLTVTSEPVGARVTVDGREVGRTPCVAQYALEGGAARTVTVEVSLPDHLPQARQIELQPGAAPRLAVTLEKAAEAAGKTYVVAPEGGDFTSLVEAVEQAEPGSTIKVRPGQYEGQVNVNKPLTIVGDGPRDEIAIVGREDSNALILDTPTARIAGLMVLGHSEEYVVANVRSGSPVIEDCLFETLKPSNALYVRGVTAKPLFRRCTFRGAGSEDPVVWVGEHGKPTFEDCLFTGGSDGVRCQQGSRSTFRGCRFLGNRELGASVDNGCTAAFENCTFKGNPLNVAVGAEVTKVNCVEE